MSKKVYNIPIYGEIGVEFTQQMLLLHLHNAKEFDTINLDISSIGGYVDVALDMKNSILKTGKKITSSNSGNVCSAASMLFCLGSERTFYPEKGVFLIHNPFGKIEGDAETFKNISEALLEIENELAEIYVENTNADFEIIKGFMKENKPLTENEIETLGFAKIETLDKIKIKAKAKININSKNDKMKKNEEKLNSIQKMISDLTKAFKNRFKAAMFADVDGNEVTFPDAETIDEIAVGMVATTNEGAANGTYTFPTGLVVICENGKVTDVTQPQAADEDKVKKLEEEVKEKEEEIEKLEEEVKEKEEEIEKLEEEVKVFAKMKTKLEKEFESFKNKFTDGKPNGKNEPVKNETHTFTFKMK